MLFFLGAGGGGGVGDLVIRAYDGLCLSSHGGESTDTGRGRGGGPLPGNTCCSELCMHG